MATISFLPLAGINTRDEDASLQRGGDNPRLYVRDAVNVDVTASGKIEMRKEVLKVSDHILKSLWQSPLHGDVFAVLGDQWVKVNPADWTTDDLALIGDSEASHIVLNNVVCVSGQAGLFTFDGQSASKLTIDTPSAPLVITGAGSLVGGTYGVAIAWLRGKTVSATSSMASVSMPSDGSLDISFPPCYDPTITHVRLYLTKPDGGELLRAEDYAIATASVIIPLPPQLGAAAEFRHCEPMPTGRYLSYWRGRILTAKANVLRFSEAMAYHIHNPLHGFILFPQRITFLAPVDGGIWVGQMNHVVFLSGADLGSLELQRKSARAPIPNSIVYLDADAAGQYDQGGAATVVWLADNGYVAGTAAGQIIENNAGTLGGITAKSGTSVVLGERLLTVVG